MDSKIGKIISGKYRIDRELPKGGMAEVYIAFDLSLKREAVIKFIRPDMISKEYLDVMRRRFDREAKVLAGIQSNDLVKVYEYGEQDGEPFLVMEYMEGRSLAEKIEKQKIWNYRDAAKLLLPIARGLEVCHNDKQKIVHRDVKPGNILFNKQGEAHISDFGIVHLDEPSDDDKTLTLPESVLGSPPYMAPEQVQGKVVDRRTDVFALGIVLFEIVCGRRPFVGESSVHIMYNIVHQPLEDPQIFIKDLPLKVKKVLKKALAKKPEDRYQTMAEFQTALEELISGRDHDDGPSIGQKINWGVIVAIVCIGIVASVWWGISAPGEQMPSVPSRIIITDDSNQKQTVIAEMTELQKVTDDAKPGAPTIKNTPNNGGIITKTVTPTGPFEPMFTNTATMTTSPSSTYTSTTPSNTSTQTPSLTSTETLYPSETPTELPAGASQVSEKDEMVEVYVPAGSFWMGSDDIDRDINEKPKHEVSLSAFWIDKYEVTNVNYEKCVNSGECKEPKSKRSYNIENYYADAHYTDYPVIYVDWNMANTYCEWAGRRLPTEAEWEKAARGTDGRKNPWGNDNANNTFLNSCDQNCPFENRVFWMDDGYAATSPVGTYLKGASPFGGMDMMGNVSEWVADWYDENYYGTSPKENPIGPVKGTTHVIRGGSWSYRSWVFYVYMRAKREPGFNDETLGFRCAISK